ncbi:hypothetical protein SDC9_179340 [bioreactor metagenome]|uniref:Uncharacterized protein n=1 Tax=bioreactor metagenome TaxID=1076179 RepID=A0A645GYG8_9ZZZZ
MDKPVLGQILDLVSVEPRVPFSHGLFPPGGAGRSRRNERPTQNVGIGEQLGGLRIADGIEASNQFPTPLPCDANVVECDFATLAHTPGQVDAAGQILWLTRQLRHLQLVPRHHFSANLSLLELISAR